MGCLWQGVRKLTDAVLSVLALAMTPESRARRFEDRADAGTKPKMRVMVALPNKKRNVLKNSMFIEVA